MTKLEKARRFVVPLVAVALTGGLYFGADQLDHALVVACRTVVTDRAGVVLAGMLAFAFVTTIGLVTRASRVVRALPAVLLLGGLVLGWFAGSTYADSVSPLVTLGQRQDALMVALVHRAAFVVVSSLAAAMLLGVGIIGRAARATGPMRSIRHSVVVVLAFAVPSVAAALLGGGLWGAAAGAPALVALIVADQSDVSELALDGIGAIACAAVAKGAATWAMFGAETSAVDWRVPLGGAMHGFMTSAGLAFAVAIVFVVRARGWPAARATLALAPVLALLAGVPIVLHLSSNAVAHLAPQIEEGFALPVLDADTHWLSLPDRQIVYVGRASSQLDTPAHCDAFVEAHPEPFWLAVDTTDTFAHLGCLIGALERSPKHCVVRWVVRTPSNEVGVIPFFVEKTRCGWPSDYSRGEQDTGMLGDVEITLGAQPLVVETTRTRDLYFSGPGEFSVLFTAPVHGSTAETLREQWRLHGERDATLRVLPDVPMRDVISTLGIMRSLRSRYTSDDGKSLTSVVVARPRVHASTGPADAEALALDQPGAKPAPIRRALDLCHDRGCSAATKARLELHLGDALAALGDSTGAELAYYIAIANDATIEGTDKGAFERAKARAVPTLTFERRPDDNQHKTTAEDWAVVEPLLRDQLHALRACAAEDVVANVAATPVEMWWEIGRSGVIVSAAYPVVRESNDDSPGVSCMSRASKLLRFPATAERRDYFAVVRVSR